MHRRHTWTFDFQIVYLLDSEKDYIFLEMLIYISLILDLPFINL